MVIIVESQNLNLMAVRESLDRDKAALTETIGDQNEGQHGKITRIK